MVKIVGCEKESVLPVCSQPLYISLDRLYELCLLLGGVGIVKTQIEFTVVFLGQAVVQQNTLGYQIPKGATTKKGCSIYMYTGEKSTVTFPAKCNSYVVTNIGTNLGQLILTNLQTVKIPSGYTTIETQAFQNQTDLYQIEIPASVKTIGIDAFAGCNKARLTIVTPYGSAAETYAKANEIHYSSQTSLQIQAGYSKLYGALLMCEALCEAFAGEYKLAFYKAGTRPRAYYA